MKRAELIRMLVLDTIADDYENFEKIADEVKRMADRAGLYTNVGEIQGAVIDLIEMGLAKAYRLSPNSPTEEFYGIPPLNEIDDYFFWTTDEGKRIQESELEGWPFDKNGAVRDGWLPPRS